LSAALRSSAQLNTASVAAKPQSWPASGEQPGSTSEGGFLAHTAASQRPSVATGVYASTLHASEAAWNFSRLSEDPRFGQRFPSQTFSRLDFLELVILAMLHTT
jgi:hypothetical protein